MGKESFRKTEDLNRGAWTAEEDGILKAYVQAHGEGRWRDLPRKAGLKRCGKSCRLRWLNYLRPDIKRGNISEQEEDLIIRLHRLLGNKWSLIAGRLPGRTDNEIKNYWNTILRKRQQSRSSTQQLKLNSGRGKVDAGEAAAPPAAEERVIVANEGKSPASEMPEPTSGSAMEEEEALSQDRCSSPDAQMESIWDFLLNGDAQQESISDIVVENSLLHCDGEFQQLDNLMTMPSLVEQSPSCVGHLKDWTTLFEPVQEDDALDVELFTSALLTDEDKNRSLEILVSGE